MSLLALTTIVERADLYALPAVFLEVQNTFHCTPSQLGLVTSLRGVASTIFSPIAGAAGNRYNRVALIGAGCCFWGVACACIGGSQTFGQLLASRTINGLGIGLVAPISRALVADMFTETKRGKNPSHSPLNNYSPRLLLVLGRAFGLLETTGSFGGAAAALIATNVAVGTVLGVPGWRMVLYGIGLLSVLVGLMTSLCAHDYRTTPSDDRDASSTRDTRDKRDTRSGVSGGLLDYARTNGLGGVPIEPIEPIEPLSERRGRMGMYDCMEVKGSGSGISGDGSGSTGSSSSQQSAAAEVGSRIRTMAARAQRQRKYERNSGSAISTSAISISATTGSTTTSTSTSNTSTSSNTSTTSSRDQIWAEMRLVTRVRTFQIIIAQGAFGNIPWAALPFMTLWLELSCFSHAEAAGEEMLHSTHN
jgi:MFS family permease